MRGDCVHCGASWHGLCPVRGTCGACAPPAARRAGARRERGKTPRGKIYPNHPLSAAFPTPRAYHTGSMGRKGVE
jgi:hypothetical protein